MTKQTDTMSGVWPFHDKTNWYYVKGLTISLQNTLILYLGLDHFMTKPTDTMSGVWPFHDKIDWRHVWGLTISWQSKLILCLGFDHFLIKQTDTMDGAWLLHDKPDGTMSGVWPFHDKTDWHYVWGLTISWQNRLIPCMGLHCFMTQQTVLCLGFDHFVTKHTNTMPVLWPFLDKTDWYHVLGLAIAWQTSEWFLYIKVT
jgi:hypothetical protein